MTYEFLINLSFTSILRNSTTSSVKVSFYVSLCEINCIKITGTSCESTWVKILRVLRTLMSLFVSDWKKVQTSWTFFQSRKRSKIMWSCASTDTAHAQRSYITAARLAVAKWKSVFILLTMAISKTWARTLKNLYS